MSEYIVRIPSDMPYEIKAELNAWYVNSEPIVRCRDCGFFDGDLEAPVCSHPRALRKTQGGGVLKCQLDGFCAWGERREP